MKRHLPALLAYSLFFFSAWAQAYDQPARGSVLKLGPGATLVYDVDFYGSQYDFIVHLKALDDNGLSFDYEMTNPNRTRGAVHMTTEALREATAQFNYFRGGEATIDDKTSVWVSAAVYQALAGEGGAATISTDGGNSTVKIVKSKTGHDYAVINAIRQEEIRDLAYLYAESEDGEVKYWIHNDPDNPLILKMDLGWKIKLREIDTHSVRLVSAP